MPKRNWLKVPFLCLLVVAIDARAARATPVAFFQAIAGGQERFVPGLPAQSCALAGSTSAMPVPTSSSAVCTLEYQDVANLTSTIIGQAIGRVDDFNTIRLEASQEWTNFIAPPGFFLPSYAPASVGAFAEAHWDSGDPAVGSPQVNPTPFNLILSATMTVSGAFHEPSDTIFDGALDARFVLSGSTGQECDIPWTTRDGQFPSAQSCTVHALLPALYNGSVISTLQGSLSMTQDSTVFGSGPSSFRADGNFLDTMMITSFQLTDEQGNVLPLSTLNISPDSGVMLTDHGFAPIGTAVPEPATLWLALAGAGAIGRRMRAVAGRATAGGGGASDSRVGRSRPAA